jgi:hypothetical protein
MVAEGSVPEIVRLEVDGGEDEGGVGVGVGVEAVLLLPGTETPEHALSVSRSNTVVATDASGDQLLERARVAFTTSGEQ